MVENERKELRRFRNIGNLKRIYNLIFKLHFGVKGNFSLGPKDKGKGSKMFFW